MEETAAIAEAVSVTKKSLTLKENGAEEPACAIKAKMCLAPEHVHHPDEWGSTTGLFVDLRELVFTQRILFSNCK